MVAAGDLSPSVLMMAVSIVESCLDHADGLQHGRLHVLRSDPPSRGDLCLLSVRRRVHRLGNAMKTQERRRANKFGTNSIWKEMLHATE